ncbi:MAG TPA: DUF4388 domain-containing protein [Planctomycetota bacterium]
MTTRARILIADADADARRRLRLPRGDDEPVPLILPGDDGEIQELRGSLSLMSLPALLNHLAAERLTGRLALDRALLECRDGRLVRARLEGAWFPRNADLLYELLPLASGAFEFRPCPVDGPDEIGMPVPALLLEGARRADEGEEPSGSNPDRPSRTESGSPGGSTM